MYLMKLLPLGRDEDISFGNAQTKMLELAMHVLDKNQD